MSNTFKHKGQGKFKNTDTPLNKINKSTQLMWERYNSDYGEDKERQLYIKEKIAEKELKTELKSDGYYYDDEIIWDEQAEFCNDYCCTVRDEEVVNKYIINNGI